jgi:lipid A 4'-phosphatase
VKARVEYFKLTRGRAALACFAASSLLLTVFPGIDLAISGWFYQDGFHLRTQWWTTFLRAFPPAFLAVATASVAGVYLYNRRCRKNLGAIDGRKVLYLAIVLLLGPGLIVNVAFKDHFGRARPRDIAEFDGTRRFTPPFVVSRECERNCSFPSGDAAAAFVSLALARVIGRRRAVWAAAVGIGAAVSLHRIAVGAHFFSDVVTSFFLMWILADALYHYMIVSPAPPLRVGIRGSPYATPQGARSPGAGIGAKIRQVERR